MAGRIDDAFRFQETALRLRSQRQTVLASNIANADTPNYKAKDIDFAGALKESMASAKNGAPVLAATSERHMVATKSGETSTGAKIGFRSAATNNVDGNTVDMDVERNEFTDNALRYEAGVTLINGQIKSLLTAIQG